MEKKSENNNTKPAKQPSLEQLGIVFSIKENNELWVEFNPTEIKAELNTEQFTLLTFEAGYLPKNYPLVGANVAVLIDAIRRRQPLSVCISVPEDARIEVFLRGNKLLAGIVLYGAQGLGKPLGHEALNLLLKKSKVTHGLIEEAMETLVDRKSVV